MPEAAAYLPVLQSGRWFSHLSTELADQLLALARPRQLQAGQALFLRGDPPCGIYAVVRGSLIVSGTDDAAKDARAAMLTRLEPPQWFGEISLFDGKARTHDARAGEAATLLQVPHQPQRDWLQAHPLCWHEMGLLMADKLRTSFVFVEELALLPAAVRLARRILLMADSYGQRKGQGQSVRVIVASQEQLSQMLAISRQTINQILKDFESRGLVRVLRGQVEILDLDALRALSR
jgi:CRP-like cAMP-binding protein